MSQLDAQAKKVLTQIVAGLLEEIHDKNWIEPCIAAIMPGEQVPFDYCGDGECGGGQVWARCVSITPIVTAEAGTPCLTGMDMQVEVGMVGSAPWPERDHNNQIILPTAGEHTAAAELQLEQMGVMFKVITCQRFDMGKAVVGAYTPIGPDGGCVGGAWLVTVPLI
jgi:hypothetical protein